MKIGFIGLRVMGKPIAINLLEAAHDYLDEVRSVGARGDSIGMRFLIPGWTFDSKRLALVRGSSGRGATS
ncbi:hypothetical protein [Actinomyces sp. oral taxon 448]|jgi:glucarate dehydratase|uniref:hypothetical protein n=1 Tax=Actinomyces sp. oral taxon 448 TaxID=712124 RepID=UPI0025C58012|nr:hypothetical protein [Actinomyces sp. oral taxon 448]